MEITLWDRSTDKQFTGDFESKPCLGEHISYRYRDRLKLGRVERVIHGMDKNKPEIVIELEVIDERPATY